MIRVLVVHRVRLTCDLIAAALRDEANIAVVEHAQSADEALARTQRQSFDIALVNINLPDNDALRFTRAISRSKKALKVVITGLVQSKAAVLRCVEEGAAGYVLEEDSLPDLVKKDSLRLRQRVHGGAEHCERLDRTVDGVKTQSYYNSHAGGQRVVQRAG
jgi:two-component system response regulator DesR